MLLVADFSTSSLVEKQGKLKSFTVMYLCMCYIPSTYFINMKHFSQLGPQSYRIMEINICVFKVFIKPTSSYCIS